MSRRISVSGVGTSLRRGGISNAHIAEQHGDSDSRKPACRVAELWQLPEDGRRLPACIW
jgi:hypothetical protein